MSTKLPMNPDDIEIRVREVKDKPGKPVVVVFEDCRFMSDVRCLGKDKKCDTCKLKFRCYTGANLEINFVKELRCEAMDNLEMTLNEMIKAFLNAKRGVLDK